MKEELGIKMTNEIKLVVVGAGLVGLRHIHAISQQAGVALAAVVEPYPTPEVLALNVPCFETLEAMFETISPDGAILSTPTPMHVAQGLTCIQNNCPVLVEKPLATSASEAKILTDAANAAGVALLVGHHRRHNPLIQKASELIGNGAIGEIRAAQVTCWFYKPDDYFDIAPWRKKKGAGPISVNLVHDVDLMRHFCGEVVSVQAQMAPSRRGFENEDLAAAVLQFEGGAIGTITVSDSIVSPWSWELTSREYPIYPTTSESCYLLGGSQGSLSVPDLTVWSHQEGRNWWNPISGTVAPRPSSDPLINQIGNFEDVIRGTGSPLVSGLEGLKTMVVIEAVQKAAENQTLVTIPLLSEVEMVAE
jgi:predicted dehydrogenase